ncbi:hypothetical protein KKB99_06755, partial [bacterium]|nr:hypothetical protein [bacterium]MBU1025690.1 hypothetical protein [bacterium]
SPFFKGIPTILLASLVVCRNDVFHSITRLVFYEEYSLFECNLVLKNQLTQTVLDFQDFS